MVTWSKQIRCLLLSCAIVSVLFLSLKFPLTTGVVIYCWICCMLSSRAIVPCLFLSLKCPLSTVVIISCRIHGMLSPRAIVPFLFLFLKCLLTTGVVISSWILCVLSPYYLCRRPHISKPNQSIVSYSLSLCIFSLHINCFQRCLDQTR